MISSTTSFQLNIPLQFPSLTEILEFLQDSSSRTASSSFRPPSNSTSWISALEERMESLLQLTDSKSSITLASKDARAIQALFQQIIALCSFSYEIIFQLSHQFQETFDEEANREKEFQQRLHMKKQQEIEHEKIRQMEYDRFAQEDHWNQQAVIAAASSSSSPPGGPHLAPLGRGEARDRVEMLTSQGNYDISTYLLCC